MRKRITLLVAATMLALTMALGGAGAAFGYTGFVGKGEVQTALGWNNAQLQAGAGDLQFASNEVTVTERSWVCTNERNDNVQNREITTTTTTTGLVSNIARVKNQITGFNLNGFEGEPTTTTTSEGNQLNSCPSGPWTLTSPAGAPVVISSTSTLTVNGVAL